MRSEARLFSIIALFLFTIAGIYAYGTKASTTTLEWSGTTTLTLAGLLSTIIALYFAFVSRRIRPRPENRKSGEISERAGRVGFFAPHSYWSFAIGVCCLFGALGIAIHQGWLLLVSVVAAVLASGGLTFEFYVGSYRRDPAAKATDGESGEGPGDDD